MLVATFAITLIATLIGTGAGVYLGVYANNANVAKQDNQLAINLLKITSEDTAYQSRLLKEMVPSLPQDSENLTFETIEVIRKSIDDFEYPEQNIPYPAVFDKIIDDHRVYSRLSYFGMRSIYRIRESLNQTKSYAEGENKRLQEIMIANDDYLRKFREPDELSQFVDSYVRVYSLVYYQKYLDVLSSILDIQVKYLKGEITESKANDLTHEIEAKIFLGDSEPLNIEEIEKEMSEILEIQRLM